MTTKGKKSLMETLYAGMVEDPGIEYPDTDGEPMAEDEEQLYAMLDTIATLREWYAGREDAHVGGDLLFYYRMNDNETPGCARRVRGFRLRQGQAQILDCMAGRQDRPTS